MFEKLSIEVVWEAFESSSTGLQPIALPLELPNRLVAGATDHTDLGHDLSKKKPAVDRRGLGNFR